MISIPQLPTLTSAAISAIAARIDQSTPAVRRSMLRALAVAQAGSLYGLYGLLQRVAADCVPATASYEALVSWAALWNEQPQQADTASGAVTLTGAAATVVPSGTALVAPNGAQFAIDADSTIGAGGSVSAVVTCVDAGAAGNQTPGTVLSFVSPLDGVASTATVGSEGITGGLDADTVETLFARLQARLTNPPHGGSQADYVRWALEVSGITRAWCFPCYSGPGSVRVYVANDSYSGSTLASAGDVSAVQSYIESVMPVGVCVLSGGVPVSGLTVAAPTKLAVNITATDVPDSATVRANVEANLRALFALAAPEGSIKLHQIYKAFLTADGLSDFSLSAPTTDQTAAAGQILTLGTITWL